MKRIIVLLTLLMLTACQNEANIEEEVTVLGMQDAKQIALIHGSVKENETEFLVEEFVEANPSYYLFVFNNDNNNFMYKIEAKGGKILVSSNQETEKSIAQEKEQISLIAKDDDKSTINESAKDKNEQTSSDLKDQTSNVIVEKTPSSTKDQTNISSNTTPSQTQTQEPSSKSQTQTEKSNNISKDEALAIALKDSGYQVSEISDLEIKEKVENGINVIEVEFDYGQYEYEYYIVVSNGSILKKEIEFNGVLNESNELSLAQAKQAALARVPGSNDNHIKIKEDTEDGRLVYEGKIIYNNYEYEFEIDALSGIFIEWEVESLY